MNPDQPMAPGGFDSSNVDFSDPSASQFLVRVGTAGIGGSTVHILHPKKAAFPLPFTLDREVAGLVEKVGPGGENPQRAQKVLVAGIWGCATCSACVSGRGDTCEYWVQRPPLALTLRLGYGTELATMIAPSARRPAVLGALDRVRAAPLTAAGIAPSHAINLALPHLRAAATVAVIGVGGWGPVVVQVLRASTACRILELDTNEARLTGAKRDDTDDSVASEAYLTQSVRQSPDALGVRSKLDLAGKLANAIVANYGALVAAGLRSGSFLIVTGTAPARTSTLRVSGQRSRRPSP